VKTLSRFWTSDNSAAGVIPSLDASSLETQLGFGIAGDDGSWEALFGCGARRHGAGWRAYWGLLSSHGGVRNSGGGHWLAGTAAGDLCTGGATNKVMSTFGGGLAVRWRL
jgi:hypothetical protein